MKNAKKLHQYNINLKLKDIKKLQDLYINVSNQQLLENLNRWISLLPYALQCKIIKAENLSDKVGRSKLTFQQLSDTSKWEISKAMRISLEDCARIKYIWWSSNNIAEYKNEFINGADTIQNVRKLYDLWRIAEKLGNFEDANACFIEIAEIESENQEIKVLKVQTMLYVWRIAEKQENYDKAKEQYLNITEIENENENEDIKVLKAQAIFDLFIIAYKEREKNRNNKSDETTKAEKIDGWIRFTSGDDTIIMKETEEYKKLILITFETTSKLKIEWEKWYSKISKMFSEGWEMYDKDTNTLQHKVTSKLKTEKNRYLDQEYTKYYKGYLYRMI